MSKKDLEAHYDNLTQAWKDYKNEGSATAKEFIISSYTPLVESIARKFSLKRPWIFEFNDLRQAGMLGLLDAVERFDLGMDTAFGTYARIRITGSIIDEINSVDWTPRAMRQKIRKALIASQQLESAGNHNPSEEEIAEQAGLSIEDVATGLTHSQKTHVSAIDNTTVTILEGISSPSNYTSFAKGNASDANKAIEHAHQRVELDRALEELCTIEQQQVLRLHFFEERTLKEVGEILGFSASKASSLKKSGIKALGAAFHPDDWL